MPIKLCPRCGCTLTRYTGYGIKKGGKKKKTHRWHCRGGCGYVDVA